MGKNRRVDLKRLGLAITFGYLLALFPAIGSVVPSVLAGEPANSQAGEADVVYQIVDSVLTSSGLYMTFSILAFSGVGSLLANSTRIDGFVAFGCTASIFLGLITMAYSVFLPELMKKGILSTDEVWFYSLWMITGTFFLFLVCNAYSSVGDEDEK